jgi:hypothetical protein
MDFFVQELFTSRGNYGDGSNRIGQKGRIWYDSASNTFRISDGVTPGGIVISGGSSQEVVGEFSGSFEFNIAADDSTQRTVNNGETVQFRGTNGITTASNDDGVITITGPDLSSYLTNNLAASFLPSEDIAYDLGSPSKRWRQLYLSDSTINLGSAVIEALGNTIQLPANSTVGEALISTFTGSYNDLTDRPSLFSGSYNNLTDRPSIPTDINQLTDNSGLLGGGGGGGSGSDGVGISNVSVNESGRLIVTLTDTSTVDAGYVIGPQGIQGETGPQGSQGPQGIQGETGPQGSQGIQGETGPQGSQGTAGADGSDGVGVSTASIDESGNLIITLTDTSTVNTGNVYANTGNITFATTTIDTADSSGITFTPAVSFNSDLTVENDLIVRNQIRTVFATESFVQQAVNELIGAAPEALNTLQELAAALNNDENFATTLLSAITNADNAVRFDTASQNLTEQQKQNARTNIDAVSAADVYAAAIVMG